MKTQWQDCMYMSGRDISGGTWIWVQSPAWIWDFQSPGLGHNKRVLFKFPACGICYRVQADQGTISLHTVGCFSEMYLGSVVKHRAQYQTQNICSVNAGLPYPLLPSLSLPSALPFLPLSLPIVPSPPPIPPYSPPSLPILPVSPTFTSSPPPSPMHFPLLQPFLTILLLPPFSPSSCPLHLPSLPTPFSLSPLLPTYSLLLLPPHPPCNSLEILSTLVPTPLHLSPSS